MHRQLPDGEIYWVNNRNDRKETINVTFRISGKVPQLWHPETGQTEPASYTILNGRTTVSLNLTPNDAVFVLFTLPATASTVTLPRVQERTLLTVDGPWTVAFQPNRGSPDRATFAELASFTDNIDTGIKYFSGTATYTRTINVPNSTKLTKETQLWLDLGDVKNMAEVVVNGKSLGVVWKKPFRVEVSNDLKAGENQLEIRVANLWVNRLIGDQQPDMKQKITYTTLPFYKATSPLLPAGLLGPVQLMSSSPVVPIRANRK